VTTLTTTADHHLIPAEPTAQLRNLTAEALGLLDRHVSSNTLRAYASDLEHVAAFTSSLDEQGQTDLAALYAITLDPAQIVNYLAAHQGSLKASTLARRVAALSKLHANVAARTTAPNVQPTRDPAVRQALAGLRRHQVAKLDEERQTKPAAQLIEKAGALTLADLRRILDSTSPTRPREARDRALIALGFSLGLRRSELVAINVEDVEITPQGLLVSIAHSKTDQGGYGARLTAEANPEHPDRCPVTIYQAHLMQLRRAHLDSGPLFRQISREGRILTHRLGAQAVGRILITRARAAGLEPSTVSTLSAHSLRRGGATALADAGASVAELMTWGRWATPSIALGYVEASRPFQGRRGLSL